MIWLADNYFYFTQLTVSPKLFLGPCTLLILEHTLTRLFKLFLSFTDNLLYQVQQCWVDIHLNVLVKYPQ